MNRCRLKHKGYAWIRRDDGGPDLFAHFQLKMCKKVWSAIIPSDGNEEWAKFGVVEGSIPTLDAITFAFGCSWYGRRSFSFDLVGNPFLCSGRFVFFRSCLVSAVGCRGVESFALFQVFFSSFHLYLKGSSDLDRVGSMVGEQDWLKNGDRVQFAEMMNQRSLAEIHMNRIAKLSHFWHWCLFSCKVENPRLSSAVACSDILFLTEFPTSMVPKRFVQLRSCPGKQLPQARRWSIVKGGAARGHLEETESVSVAH